jgi:hypothetical protein
MAPSSRDRISVDLQGLKGALHERAHAVGMLPSAWVRMTLADALGRPADPAPAHTSQSMHRRDGSRARLSLRMTRAQAMAVMHAAHRAGMNAGDYVADLVADVPVAACGYRRADHIFALTASCAELSSFCRSLNHLTSLLRNGSFRVALDYQVMLDRLDDAVESHLRLASKALGELCPPSRAVAAPRRADH